MELLVSSRQLGRQQQMLNRLVNSPPDERWVIACPESARETLYEKYKRTAERFGKKVDENIFGNFVTIDEQA